MYVCDAGAMSYSVVWARLVLSTRDRRALRRTDPLCGWLPAPDETRRHHEEPPPLAVDGRAYRRRRRRR